MRTHSQMHIRNNKMFVRYRMLINLHIHISRWFSCIPNLVAVFIYFCQGKLCFRRSPELYISANICKIFFQGNILFYDLFFTPFRTTDIFPLHSLMVGLINKMPRHNMLLIIKPYEIIMIVCLCRFFRNMHAISLKHNAVDSTNCIRIS